MATRTSKVRQLALAKGYRSGLEVVIQDQLTAAGIPFRYEELKLKYVKPEKAATYTPDFELPNGIIVETKGRFTTDDRQKQLLVKQQHPERDIRFVFSNSRTRISKASKTTYADWCIKNNFQFADKRIPEAWLKETTT